MEEQQKLLIKIKLVYSKPSFAIGRENVSVFLLLQSIYSFCHKYKNSHRILMYKVHFLFGKNKA